MHKFDGEFQPVHNGINSERSATDEHADQSDGTLPTGGSTTSGDGDRVTEPARKPAKRSHHKLKPLSATGSEADQSSVSTRDGKSIGME